MTESLPPSFEPNESLTHDACHPRLLAHLGDAVYELFVREQALAYAVSCGTQQLDTVHRYSVNRVKSVFQQRLLQWVQPQLTDAEATIVRRARNMQQTTRKRHEQTAHRQATSFEALIGYLYLCDRERLHWLFEQIRPFVCDPDALNDALDGVGD